MSIETKAFTAKLRAAFEHSVPGNGVTLIHFSHPNAPSLLLTRNAAAQPQVVPVLIAGTRAGGQGANTDLGIELSKAGRGWVLLFQGITDGDGFYGIMAPFLFYRAPADGTFRAAAAAACREASERGLLTSWFFVYCGGSYLTKDGRLHKPEDYRRAFATEPEDKQPWARNFLIEAVCVAFRKHTLLALDDCLYALQSTIPQLTRSALHRCFQRHGISRLPELEGHLNIYMDALPLSNGSGGGDPVGELKFHYGTMPGADWHFVNAEGREVLLAALLARTR